MAAIARLSVLLVLALAGCDTVSVRSAMSCDCGEQLLECELTGTEVRTKKGVPTP